MRFFSQPSHLVLGTIALACLDTGFFVSAAPRLEVDRAEAVKNAFVHAWSGYYAHAFGHDEVLPVSNGTSDSRNGWGATIFDSLDTMLIMGLEEQYNTALDFVKRVNWKNAKGNSKTFETNIRYLGGLLAAYDLRPDQALLDKAVELADQVIMPAYNTKNGIPAAYVDVDKEQPIPGKEIYLAEFGSLQLELTRLSQITGNDTYQRVANGVIERLSQVRAPMPGLYDMTWSMQSFLPASPAITISGGSDSYYEYLLKTHILMGGTENLQIGMWRDAVGSMHEHLRSESVSGEVYLAEVDNNLLTFQTGELICFIPATLMLGSRYLNDPSIGVFAKELMDSCSNAWEKSPTGLAPESWSWIDKNHGTGYSASDKKYMDKFGYIPNNNLYDLRPETLESLFYFYRTTGEEEYRNIAWRIFQAIEKYCKTPTGYSRIADVTNPNNVRLQDFQESYLFAETLKYLYLIFADPNAISLDNYIFNTEGHPLKLLTPIRVQANF